MRQATAKPNNQRVIDALHNAAHVAAELADRGYQLLGCALRDGPAVLEIEKPRGNDHCIRVKDGIRAGDVTALDGRGVVMTTHYRGTRVQWRATR
jgi:hypothetical protein